MTHRSLILGALAPIALLAACGLAPEEKLAEAEASFEAHDYSGAKVYLVSALKDLPGDPATLLLLARTQIAMGDGEGAFASLEQIGTDARAIPEFRELLAEAELLRGNTDKSLEAIGVPQSANAARIAALAHLSGRDFDAAFSAVEAGRKLPGNPASLLAVFSQLQLAQGKTADALATANKALAADSDDLDALLASARAHQAAYDLPATLAVYEKAAKLYPQNIAAELGRVATLAELGRLEEAKNGLARLAELAPKSIHVIHLRARIALEQEDWATARDILQGHEAALREHPHMQASYATALLRVGQPGQAHALLEPLVEDFPGSREPRTLLAEAKLAQDDAAGALATIRTLAERPDARPEELKIAAEAAKAAGDRSAARYVERSKGSTPEWIGGELAKADMALRNRQWAKAVESYEAIDARTSSPNAMVLNNLAFAKSQLGETEAAIEIALKAARIAPDHPAVLDTAGWLLVESGRDRSRGITMLEKASRLAPDNAAIARRLAKAQKS